MSVHPDPHAPRANRVRPDGELLAVPDRGLLWGNRGALLDRSGERTRYASTKAWIACVLEFKGRQRIQWRPGRLTELYFLDEATAFAAGHRPCGECRIPDYRAFRDLWMRVHPDEPHRAPDLDARLEVERLVSPGVRRTSTADASGLPDGTMIAADGGYWLVRGEVIREWTPGGYVGIRARPHGPVTVVTPPSIVGVLAQGYQPLFHPSAST